MDTYERDAIIEIGRERFQVGTMVGGSRIMSMAAHHESLHDLRLVAEMEFGPALTLWHGPAVISSHQDPDRLGRHIITIKELPPTMSNLNRFTNSPVIDTIGSRAVTKAQARTSLGMELSTAAGVRDLMRAEDTARDLRDRIAAFDQAWFIREATDGWVIRVPRMLDPVIYDLDEPKRIDYVFIRTDGKWFGTGRSAPTQATDEDLVNWLVDHDIQASEVEAAQRWERFAPGADAAASPVAEVEPFPDED